VFDFDGLIADTETPEFESWCAEFQHHGRTLALEDWIKCVGAGPTAWDVFDHLESLLGKPFDRGEVAKRRRQRFLDLTAEMSVMPGVVTLLDEARSEGVPCAIASSSEGHWVNGYLDRFELADRFEHVVTRDQVPRPKPAPDLYVEACRRLAVSPANALALEDSTNGVRAAKGAGLTCVAVPNSITMAFDFSHADARLDTLSGVTLTSLQDLATAD